MAFEPVDDAASSALDEIVSGPAAALTAVTLLVGEAAQASGWAARAAVAIARRWPGVRRPVLVDLDFRSPVLHEVAGVANEEGMADVVEYGVSLARVRQPVPGGEWDVVAAGPYVADPVAVLRSPAWLSVLQELARERGTLLAYVPARADGAALLVERIGTVLVLAEAAEADAIVTDLPNPYAVLAVVVPRTTEVAGAASSGATAVAELGVAVEGGAVEGGAATLGEDATEAGPPEPEDDEPLVIAAAASEVLRGGDGPPAAPRISDQDFDRIRLPTDRASREALIADLRERQRAARLSPAPDSELLGLPSGPPAYAHGDEQAQGVVLLPSSGGERARDLRVETMPDELSLDTLDPGEPQPAAPRRDFRKPLAWTLAIVLAVSLLGGAWRFLAGRLGQGHSPAAIPVAEAPPAQPEAEPEVVAEVELPYVVAIEAHTDLATAFRRLDALEQEPGLAFHIAPLEREGTLYYHIMAGPVRDSASAVAVRDTLLARRLKTASTPTDVRHAPLSFLVGEYSDTAAADEAMAELRRLDVPSYMQLAEAADGAPLHRVFVGAFSAPAEADVTRQLLRAAGVRDSLVTRMGSITQ